MKTKACPKCGGKMNMVIQSQQPPLPNLGNKTKNYRRWRCRDCKYETKANASTTEVR